MKKIALLSLFLSTGLQAPPLNTPHAPHAEMFKHFWNVAETLQRIQSKSLRTVDVSSLVEVGLKAMVNKVDAHSSFFTPQSYQSTIHLASGQFPGVGVSIINKAVDEDSLLIVDVIPGGPADIAGIEGGDKIIEVDGTKLRGLTSDEVVTRLKGKIDSTVTIKVTREKKPLEFLVTRKIIKDRSVFSYYFGQQRTAYIAIKTFSEKTPALVRSLLESAYKKQARSILIDLRKNPGGVLESAIKACSLFLPNNSLVATTQRSNKQVVRSYHTTGTPVHDSRIPVFLITDNFTASSSEIMTGCLQHYAHAENGIHTFVVGMPTFGKGSVQEIMPLSYGCALKLTTMLYYLPNNQCLQARGIAPDITIKPRTVPEKELRWIESLYGKESSLTNHITREEVDGKPRPETTPKKESLNKKPTAAMSPKEIEESFQQSLANDHTVQTCLTLSNLYHFAAQCAPDQIATHAKALAFLQKQVITDEIQDVSTLK